MRKIGYGYDYCGCGDLKSTRSSSCRACQKKKNRPPIDSSIYVIEDVRCRRIPLTKNRYTIVDETDYEPLMGLNWYTSVFSGYLEYATAHGPTIDGRRETILMHIFLLGKVEGKEIDHWNGSGLDNRRNNIRHAEHWQNLANMKKRESASGFRGVKYQADMSKWIAKIHCKGEWFYLGAFNSAIEAAIAYDDKAIELFGVFANLNFSRQVAA